MTFTAKIHLVFRDLCNHNLSKIIADDLVYVTRLCQSVLDHVFMTMLHFSWTWSSFGYGGTTHFLL